MSKAINATVKAYVIHNLPVYLFYVAGMFEFIGETAKAKDYFRKFLQAQNNFQPDDIDVAFINQLGFDIRTAVDMARERVG